MRVIVLIATIALAAASPAVPDDRIVLHFAECQDAGQGMRELLAGLWPPWAPYVQVCPVHSPGGQTVISILTVRVDLVDEDEVGDSWPIPFPHALILDARNVPVGELAAAVPGGPPGTTIVSFSDWRNNFPYRIDVREVNAAVFGTYNRKPLVWNPNRRKYE